MRELTQIGVTTLSALNLGIVTNDTVLISGTLRSGVAVSGTYSVLNPATDTISGLLSAIQFTFNQQVSATIDSSGKITLTDTTAGDSQLSIGLTANNQGGGTLAFGGDTVVTQGRYSLPVQAVISGNFIALEATSFGAGGFTLNGLGLVNQIASGTNVAGTINGLAATGSGQSLRGTTGSVDGLGLFYTGSAVGAVGNVTVGMGAGAAFDGLLDIYSNSVSGFIQNSIKSDQTTFDNLTSQIANQTRQMEQQRVTLTRQFTQMQQSLALLQQSSGFLTAQINAQRAG